MEFASDLTIDPDAESTTQACGTLSESRTTIANSFEVNENSDIYYLGSTYWNDLEVVQRRINERISGDPTRKWHEHLARQTGRTFKRALILNCGNGWVERELVEYGLVAEAVGMDYSQPLVEQAAAAGGRVATYVPPGERQHRIVSRGEFDLVVNHAARHHIAAIDRVFREVCRILPEDGVFVSLDYVGPHRLQYRLDAWEEVWRLNHELPESLRHDLLYPPMPVALVVDPTEAIHSELILPTFHRYFAEDQFTPLGGAVAYPLLTHNTRVFASEDDGWRGGWIERILQADDEFLEEHPDSSLFAYFSGRPVKAVLRRTDLLDEWGSEERTQRADSGTAASTTSVGPSRRRSSRSKRCAPEHGHPGADRTAAGRAHCNAIEARVRTCPTSGRLEVVPYRPTHLGT